MRLLVVRNGRIVKFDVMEEMSLLKRPQCRGNRYVLVTSHNCRAHLIDPAACMRLGQLGSLF
jgi:hypothetical protein